MASVKMPQVAGAFDDQRKKPLADSLRKFGAAVINKFSVSRTM
jgi:hypothetical protein